MEDTFVCVTPDAGIKAMDQNSVGFLALKALDELREE